MTENVPKLRRLLNEAMERIRVLEAEKVLLYSPEEGLLEARSPRKS